MSSTEDTKTNQKTKEDELSALLDSALEDFEKVDLNETASKTEPKNGAESESSAEEIKAEEWGEDFINQAAAEFEKNMASLLSGAGGDGEETLTPDAIQEKFKQLAEAANQALSNPTVTEDSNDFAKTITQTIQGLNEGAENLQAPFSEADIMNLFGGQRGEGGANSFMPFMQGMMQSLLSKEVLYPSLKDILERFPEWLTENRSKLSAEDIVKYEKQIQLMKDVCAQLEKENPSDSVEKKREQFEKVLDLMKQLQDYGQPPAEVVGDVGAPLPLDLADGSNQCNVM